MVKYQPNYIGPDNDGSTIKKTFGYIPLKIPLVNTSSTISTLDYKAAEPIKEGDKLQLVSADEPYKVIKLRHLKEDAFVFEFENEAKMFEDSPFCIGVALNDAENINDIVTVQLLNKQ